MAKSDKEKSDAVYRKDENGKMKIPTVDVVGTKECKHLKTGETYSVTKETAEILVAKGSAKYKGGKDASLAEGE